MTKKSRDYGYTPLLDLSREIIVIIFFLFLNLKGLKYKRQLSACENSVRFCGKSHCLQVTIFKSISGVGSRPPYEEHAFVGLGGGSS